MIRTRALIVVLLVIAAAPVGADTQFTSRSANGTTYLTGRTATGRTMHSTSRDLGGTTYSSFRDGNRITTCATRRLNSQAYTTCR